MSRASDNIFKQWLDIRPSRYLALFLLLLHGGALLVVMNLLVPLPVQLSLVGVCVLSFIYNLRLHALRLSPQAIIRLWQQEDGQWQLMNRQGQTFSGTLLGDSYLAQHILVLNFKIPHKRFITPLVLFSDALASKEFRRLRVHLITSRKSDG